MKNKFISMLFVGLSFFALADSKIGITSVEAHQRYPWGGLVDISVTIQGTAETMAKSECSFAAANSATKSAIPVEHITQDGIDSEFGGIWTRRFVWDAAADAGKITIDDVTFTVVLGGDLGLPYVQLWENGPYWAKCNVGANEPEECGYYFWWGDVVGYKRVADNWEAVDGSQTGFSFDEESCPTHEKTDTQLRWTDGYIDSAGSLVPAHDAATMHLGAPWRMPTDTEFEDLVDKCDIVRMTRNGVQGRLVKGKGAYSSRSMFLPAAGYGYGTGLVYLGSNGRYWSSTSDSKSAQESEDPYNHAWSLCFDLADSNSYWGDFYRNGNSRYFAQSVRPVRGSPSESGIYYATTHLALDCRGTIGIQKVEACQRYSWSGLVDIVVTLQGTAEDLSEVDCVIAAINGVSKDNIPVEHIIRNGADCGSGTVWTRKYVWDAAKDVGAVKLDDVVLTINLELPYVRLWENGPYWAKCNVGATKPEECGYYFMWGATSGYKRVADHWDAADGSKSGFSFSIENHPFHIGGWGWGWWLFDAGDGHVDATGNLLSKVDVATSHLGSPWHMPTTDEFTSLVNTCSTKLTTRNGVVGLLVTGKGNYAKNSIFLPASGHGNGIELEDLGEYGNYWSSTTHSFGGYEGDQGAWMFAFGGSNEEVWGSEVDCYKGRSVRPLRETACEVQIDKVETHLALDCRKDSKKLEVKNIEAQQRYPWNGLVDIVVTIQGEADDVEQAECQFVATNIATGATIPIQHIMRSGEDSGYGFVWTRHFVWNAVADVGTMKAGGVAITVNLKQPGVQLWENGPYWAECNVGAANPGEYGYYFWWGETVGYRWTGSRWDAVDGSRIDYSFCGENCPTDGKSSSKLRSAGYVDKSGNLVSAHDAATVYLGATWRMPTYAEFTALRSNCTSTWTTYNGVMGRLVTGKGDYSSRSIFFPAAGYGHGSALNDLGANGYYWSSTPHWNENGWAIFLECSSSSFFTTGYPRYEGRSIRPLRDFTDVSKESILGVTAQLELDCREGVRSISNDVVNLCYDVSWYTNANQIRIIENGTVVATAVSGCYTWHPRTNCLARYVFKLARLSKKTGG